MEVLQNELMSNHTSFKIGGPADYYIIAKTIEDVKEAVSFSKGKGLELIVIGNGTNVLVRDGGIRGVVLQIAIDDIKQTQHYITVGAGVLLSKVAKIALDNSLTGLEFAYGIPGTMGGAIKMNAGAYGGEIKDVVFSSTYINEKLEIKTINNVEHEFRYRHSFFSDNNEYIILSSKIKLMYGEKEEIQSKMNELMKARREKQPLKFPSAGSTFKRGNGFITAQIIDECGLKGHKVGGAMVSELHAGFIINTGDATANDVLELVEYVKTTVKEKCDKELELEIVILGEDK